LVSPRQLELLTDPVGRFTLQGLETIDVLPDDVLPETLAFQANKATPEYARVPMVAKHGVRIAWTYDFSSRLEVP
jgi:hypothetical protein